MDRSNGSTNLDGSCYGSRVSACDPSTHGPLTDDEVIQTSRTIFQPGTEWVQALADISRSALCCHINETRTPTANPPNSAQLRGHPTISPSYIRACALCSSVGMQRRTDTDTQTAVITIHFASSTTFTWVNGHYNYVQLYVSAGGATGVQTMGNNHNSRGSWVTWVTWVSSLMGQMGHVTHCQLCYRHAHTDTQPLR